MLRPFDYHRPKTIAEACALLAEKPEVAVLAGGTDLLIKIRDGKHRVANVVDIKGVAGLERIRREGDVLVFGALATVTDVLRSPEVRAAPGLGLLLEAAGVFGCDEIRHRATICGNIANASPGSEFGSPMFVLEAECVVEGPGGRRTEPVARFYKGPGATTMKPGELLSALRVPLPPATARSTYMRRSRVRGMDLAGLNMAMLVLEPDDPARRSVRLAMGAVSGVPLRAPEVEALLSGRPITRARMDQARAMLSAGINPRPTSMRATPEYKKAMVAHLAEAALAKLLAPFPEVEP